MGLTSSILKRLPITSAMIYLAIGILVGLSMLGIFHFSPIKESALLEVLTEVAVLISLFSAGIKMPVPFSFARWRTPILLATASMTLSVAMVAPFSRDERHCMLPAFKNRHVHQQESSSTAC